MSKTESLIPLPADGSPPLPAPEQYQPFSLNVGADIDLVASTTGSLTATNAPGSVIVEEIDSEFLRRTETSPINEYHPGFLQISQRLTHYVNIGGVTAIMEEESLVTSVAQESPASIAELTELGKNYISQRYGDVGGQIIVNSFQQTKRFNSLTDEEIDRLTSLEDLVSYVEDDLVSLTETVETQDEELISLIHLKRTVRMLNTTVNTLLSKQSEQEDLVLGLTMTQDSNSATLATLKKQQSAQDLDIATLDTKISTLEGTTSTLESTSSTLNTKVMNLENTSSSQSTSLSAVATRVTGLENKQTKIVNPPTGSLKPEGCLITCVGSSGQGSTSWGSYRSGVWVEVDMTECGFTSTPVITASVEGGHYHMYMTQAVYRATSTRFTMHMRGWVTTSATSSFPDWGTPASNAASYNWHVNWSATGYTC